MDRFSRYIRNLLLQAPPFTPPAGQDGLVQVERGSVLIDTLLQRPVSATNRPPADFPDRVIDHLGHSRSVYAPLLATAWAIATPREDRSTLWPWIDRLMARSNDAVYRLWVAVAAESVGRPMDPLPALARNPVLDQPASIHPEAFWYDQMVALHAATAIACHRNDPALLAAVRSAASYVQDEIQPDHATTEPWGLNAMLLDPHTFPLAEQMLHAFSTQTSTLSLILLAHSLYCVEQLTP